MRVIDVAREIVRLGRRNPDHVYEMTSDLGCTYVRETSENNYEGDCIVGQALINLGIDPKILLDADNALIRGGGKTASDIIFENRSEAEVYDKDILTQIDWVQSEQDVAVEWGIAIKHLTDEFPKLFEIAEV